MVCYFDAEPHFDAESHFDAEPYLGRKRPHPYPYRRAVSSSVWLQKSPTADLSPNLGEGEIVGEFMSHTSTGGVKKIFRIRTQ